MPPSSQDILEVEWQFDAPATAPVVAWLEAANVPGYTVTTKGTKEVRDTYYDTADWRVFRARFTCRVREKKDGAELTLKSMSEAKGGMRSRRELTEFLAGTGLHSVVEAPGPGGDAVRLIAGRRPLEALFTLHQVRRIFILADGEGDIAEIAVDDTDVPGADGDGGRMARVEVEMLGDSSERAQRFVDLFIVTGGLTPGTISKYQLGLRAVGLKAVPTEATLGTTILTSESTAGEAGFAIIRKHFAVFLANEPGTRLGEDIEALHDMRVAARRLRAALQAFRPYLPLRLERIRQELGWVAAALGEVRDLDVQLERMDEWRAETGEAQANALGAIEALLQERRNAARGRMLAALNTRRYDILIERFAAILRRGAPRTFVPGQTPVLGIAPELLEKRYRRLRKLGDAITPKSEPDRYHELRIDAKRLRYALEFTGPLYGKPATDFAVRLTALQDLLGLHQDAEVAISMLREMAATASRRLGPETILTMGAISERYRQHAAELRRGFPKLYREVRGAEWRDLQKVLERQRPKQSP